MPTDQGRDRVAEVVARVAELWRHVRALNPVTVAHAAGMDIVRALDAAGLLLTEERRGRVVCVLTASKTLSDELWDERCALLRELAGEPPAPTEATPTKPARPRRMVGNGGEGPHGVDHDESATCAEYPPCQPVVVPRRMAGNPACLNDNEHAEEHDWFWECDKTPPCQPVAPRMAPNPDGDGHEAEHPWTPECEHAPRCQPVAAAGAETQTIAPDGPATTHTTRARHCDRCGQYVAWGWVHDCKPTPTHEHRWAAVAWKTWPAQNECDCTRTRVTREHCVVGDCTATREVGHGA